MPVYPSNDKVTSSNVIETSIFHDAKKLCLDAVATASSPLNASLHDRFVNSTTLQDLVTALQKSTPTTSNDAQAIYQLADSLRMFLQYSKYSSNYEGHLTSLKSITNKLQTDYPALQADYIARPQRTAGL